MRNIKSFKEFEAIGFKIPGDNRDEFHGDVRKKLGYKPQQEVEEKILSLLRKLKALSERGEEHEKEVALTKLTELAKKHGINIDNLERKYSGKLGYKFSWEDDDDYDISDIDKEIKALS